MNGAEDAADAYDCGDAFTKNVDCLKEKALCKEGKIDTDPCKTEAEAVDACTRAASAKAKK